MSQVMIISDLAVAVAQVRCFKKGKQLGLGSGFFYHHLDNLYLITNRHVVIDEQDAFYPDEVRFRLHTDPKDIMKNADYSVALYDRNGKPQWLEHPIYHDEVDVVALKLDKNRFSSEFLVQPFSANNHVPEDVEIAIGEDVLVMGYPLGFHDTLHNLPIARAATIASVYPVPFQGGPFFLIDSRLHSGTSGSPVLTKESSMLRLKTGTTKFSNVAKRFLMGVFSESWDLKGRDPTHDEPLGLNVVWFARLITEIIEDSK